MDCASGLAVVILVLWPALPHHFSLSRLYHTHIHCKTDWHLPTELGLFGLRLGCADGFATVMLVLWPALPPPFPPYTHILKDRLTLTNRAGPIWSKVGLCWWFRYSHVSALTSLTPSLPPMHTYLERHDWYLPTELGLFGLRLGCADGLAMVIYDRTLLFDALTSRSLLWKGLVRALKNNIRNLKT